MAQAGTLPSDDEDERIRKMLLVLAAVVITTFAFIWVATYWALGLPRSASIPFAYQLISLTSLVFFIRTKRYRVFRFTQILLMLLLPAFLQVSVGGFVASSGVILWSLTAPIGALLFYGRDTARSWFLAYVLVIAAAAAADPYIRPEAEQIPSTVRLLFFALNIVAVSATCFFLLQYFVRERDVARAALDREHRQLVREQERSERLLLNVLPAPIAERLKAGEPTIADAFDEVTVAFADLVGFTPLAARMGPHDLVRLLNDAFSAFDDLADGYGVEKIKTIGDAYMVAAGIPTPRPDHAVVIAEMALGMREKIVELANETSLNLHLRIGVDSGPVVAGVIGRRKFAYDLWGDIVNTASRMESHGIPGEIQFTERACRGLDDLFEFEQRGEIEVKGKGTVRTRLLIGRRSNLPRQRVTKHG
ncbi:MAG: adenylate/guanylate cyclase domain-containing protein [Actinobacteria bacterium]|nr:adenylate/guanylate cyclase domain-containing protein [Actinomycetota bacterium]